MYIGKKIKELREAQGMKLIDLARKSKIQIATLSRMENLKMTGTLESHMSIAQALGVDITQLYTDIISEENKIDVNKPKSGADIFVHSDKSSYEILASKVLSKKMMPVLLKIEANGQTNPEQNAVGTEKFIFILDGPIEVKIKDEIYILEKFHSLYFNASLEHVFINKTASMAKMICVTTPVAL